jgi:2,4-dienoyl-CoA reductase (NADPH2)
VLCNQACRVRDARNPLVSCIGEPRSGHELDDTGPHQGTGEVLVVGGGPAGLECARVLALQGFSVEIREAYDQLGGALRDASLGAGRSRLTELIDWLAGECARLGVRVVLGHHVDRSELEAHEGPVVLATGSRPRDSGYVDSRAALRGELPDGPVLVNDPVGGPAGVSVAEHLAASGREVRIVTQDPIVGTLLSLTGDLADCNTRLQRSGVTRDLKSLLRKASDGTAVLEDVWTGAQRRVPAQVVVDCGPRLPDEDLYETGMLRAGDCVAPRTVLEAVLEGRRVALGLAT